jgi:hypothetical protein
MVVEDLDWQMERLPEPREFSFNGSGPHVVAYRLGRTWESRFRDTQAALMHAEQPTCMLTDL